MAESAPILTDSIPESPVKYSINLTLSVDNLRTLWIAAAQRCLENTDLTREELEDTIGPCDDPSIEDCLTMLAMPHGFAGCTITDFGLYTATRQSDWI